MAIIYRIVSHVRPRTLTLSFLRCYAGEEQVANTEEAAAPAEMMDGPPPSTEVEGSTPSVPTQVPSYPSYHCSNRGSVLRCSVCNPQQASSSEETPAEPTTDTAAAEQAEAEKAAAEAEAEAAAEQAAQAANAAAEAETKAAAERAAADEAAAEEAKAAEEKAAAEAKAAEKAKAEAEAKAEADAKAAADKAAADKAAAEAEAAAEKAAAEKATTTLAHKPSSGTHLTPTCHLSDRLLRTQQQPRAQQPRSKSSVPAQPRKKCHELRPPTTRLLSRPPSVDRLSDRRTDNTTLMRFQDRAGVADCALVGVQVKDIFTRMIDSADAADPVLFSSLFFQKVLWSVGERFLCYFQKNVVFLIRNRNTSVRCRSVALAVNRLSTQPPYPVCRD